MALPTTHTITPAEAAAGLHVLESPRRWPEPGSFIKSLVGTMLLADPQNLAKLWAVFPGYAAAVDLYKHVDGGIDVLIGIADGKE